MESILNNIFSNLITIYKIKLLCGDNMKKKVYKTRGRSTSLRAGLYVVSRGKAIKMPSRLVTKHGKYHMMKGTNLKSRDRFIRAKPPGFRISKSGKKYYESRANRSDNHRAPSERGYWF